MYKTDDTTNETCMINCARITSACVVRLAQADP